MSRLFASLALVVSLAGCGSKDNGPPMDFDPSAIPVEHPRLWWTPARLAAARSEFAGRPFTTPSTVNDPDVAIDRALHHVLSGPTGASSCRPAIDWAMGIVVSTEGVASDNARWNGEAVIVVYDWCHDELTPAERATLIQRWNTTIADLNAKPWGGIGMEGNNYYLGYWRNTLAWAIASYHENPQAPGFLTYALTTRWQQSLMPYLDSKGKGGIMQEGSAYGMRTTSYYTLPVTTLALLGRDLWNETPFFRSLIYWTIYATTPGPTPQPCGDVYEVFPFNEDERWYERDCGGNTPQTNFGTFVTPLIAHWASEPVAGHAKRYLELTGQPVEARFVSYTHPPASLAHVASRPLDTLPLDYFAAGMGTLYAKDAWSPDATAIVVQGLNQVGVGHNHDDEGSFQMWRAGAWLSRESVGYTHQIADVGGVGQVDCARAVGHNSLLSNGVGSFGPPGVDGHSLGRPRVQRLESRDAYAYIAVDLTPAYQVSPAWSHRLADIGGDRRVAGMVREFLFIRGLDTLVVFDRIDTTSGTPAEIVKTFLLHFETAPALIDASTVEATIGDQALRVTTLLPAVTTRRVIVEGSTIGQHRLELDQSGAGQAYFLNVLQGKNAGGANLTLTLEDLGASYRLTLGFPAGAPTVITFVKGATSAGGTFGGAPLRGDVQPMTIGASGPIWGP